jgi:hypothetical protein
MNQLYSFFYQRNLIKAISFDDNYLSLRFIATVDTMISSQTEKSKSKSLYHIYSIFHKNLQQSFQSIKNTILNYLNHLKQF